MSDTLPPVAKVAICGNRFQSEYLIRINRLIQQLRLSGIEVFIERNFYDYLADKITETSNVGVIDAPVADVGAIISIGGDGTFIRAARKAGSSGIPIAGVNTGHLGFLANFSIDSPEELVELLSRGGALMEPRHLLRISSPLIPSGVSPYVLNEVAFLKEETSSMISIHVEIDGFFLADFLADGLIVATPTGSTAYNLSIGGPILQPGLNCMVLSPVAPHSLTMRPIVVDGNSRLRLTATSRVRDFRVSIDGTSFTLPCGVELGIEPADFFVNVLRRPGENFPATLRETLLWSRSKTPL